MNDHVTQQFEELFEAYRDVVFRLCLFKTSNREVAADITQDVFVKLYEYLLEHNLPDKPKSFIYQMARNKIIDHYRKHGSESLDAALDDGAQFMETCHGHQQIEDQAEYGLALEALNQLDETYREVLFLRLVEDHSVGEIAEMLGISNSNVSVRLNRGKKQLQKLLQS